MITSNISSLFDSGGFTPILPFNQDNPLKDNVQSDHAEIALKVDDRVINIWNISNPEYHCYFKYGENPPFHHTDLFVNKPFLDDVMDKGLEEKINDQINTIATRFVEGKVNIQIIVEGFDSFYNGLTDKIKELGSDEFQIIRNTNLKGNITGILVDTSKFKILTTGGSYSKYNEIEDSNKEKELRCPIVRVKDKLTAKTTIFIGVHVNGCGSQYPKGGLKAMKDIIEENYEITSKKFDVIAAGDFNTPPMHARESIIQPMKHQAVLLNAPYPTHVNPKSQVANYDQVVIVQADATTQYEMLPASEVSVASQNLINSIELSREKYLRKSIC